MPELQMQIREIPVNPFLNGKHRKQKKLCVAACCRVSTEEEEQQHSFETQAEAALAVQHRADTQQGEKPASIFENLGCDLTEYSDTLVARTIERVSVGIDCSLAVRFTSGQDIAMQTEK